MGRKSEPRECKCGCGEYTRGGLFRMGHNARYESAERDLNKRVTELVEAWSAFDSDYTWLKRAAYRFGEVESTQGLTARGMARAIITHPRMQDTEYNRRNGYTPYTSARELYSRILYVSS